MLWRTASFSTRWRNSLTEKLTTDENGPDIDRAVRKVLSHTCELNNEMFKASSVIVCSDTSIARYVRLCAFSSIEKRAGIETNKFCFGIDVFKLGENKFEIRSSSSL
jgi:hypothetical protein